MLLLLGAALQAAEEQPLPEAPWGAGLRELKRLHPDVMRSYAGLDGRSRARIQRFRSFETHFGIRTETSYDFVGRRLFQVEYNFQQPNDLTFKLASSELATRYGAPLSSSESTLPTGGLFAERSLSDTVWRRPGLDISLRRIFSRFANGTVVRQMFVVMRSGDVLRSDSRPLQMQSDAEMEKSGAVLRLAFAGGFDPQRLKNGATLDGVKRLLDQADLAVATLDGALAEAKGASPDGPLFAADAEGAALIGAAGIDIVSMASGGAVSAGADAALVGADLLKRAGVETVGFGRNRKAAEKALLLEIGGLKIAVLAFAFFGNAESCAASDFEASTDAPAFSGSCAEALRFGYDVAARVAEAAAQSDVTVALFGWDAAVGRCSDEAQLLLTDAAWNAGADLVIGHRRGVIQSLRGAPGKAAFISCGDLLPASGRDAAGLIFIAEINRAGLVSYDFKPLLFDGEGSPHKAADDEARRIMDDLRAQERRCNEDRENNKGNNR